ncbi:MAG: 30S ribosomal protein S1 [Pleomorphochaeta sp.]
MNNKLEEGQLIKTTILAIYGDSVFIDLNMKSEGIIDSSEFLNNQGELTVKNGDTVSAYYIGYEKGEMLFTTKLKGDKANSVVLEKAYHSKIPVEGTVLNEIKGGYQIKIGDSQAFCPYSQMGYRQKEEPSFFINKTLPFIIQEFNREQHNIIVSNRLYLENVEKEKIQKLKEELKVGMIVNGTVISLQTFGAFVDIEGIQALLPISEINRSRVNNIEEVLSVGQNVEAKILSLDLDRKRMSISSKVLIKDPWDDVLDKYTVGDKLEGTISKIMNFGIFVNLEPGIDGLVFISKLSDANENTNLKKIYKIGSKMFVEIDEILQDEHKIALSPTKSTEEEDSIKDYMSNQDDDDDDDTYNPFAAFFKK